MPPFNSIIIVKVSIWFLIFYKLTLRFLRLKKIQYKDEIKLDIKKELHCVRSRQ